MELLEPTARHLGELWQEDTIDFVDVTLGVSKLQRLVHVFAGLDHVAPYDDKRKVLLASAPGDQHSLGNSMVQKFFRAAAGMSGPAPRRGSRRLPTLPHLNPSPLSASRWTPTSISIIWRWQ